jgi:hypothetical protein
MGLSRADLPAVLAAINSFRQGVAASPPDYTSKEAHAHAVIVSAKEEVLRRALTPSNPDWKWNQSEDLHAHDLPPKLGQLLKRAWEWIVRDMHRLPPPFPPDQRDDWLVLLDEAETELRLLNNSPASDEPQYVTLDQAAARVNRHKKTLERRVNRKGSDAPPPDVEGGGGKPHEWRWSTLRPWLEKEFGRKLPDRIPSRARRG